MHDLSRHFYSHDFAGVFYNWDILLFGAEPTLWAQRFYSPLLTDYMAFAYALYFVFPLVIMFFLSHEDRRFEFREMALAVTFAFIMGFIGYVIWPTSPPRYFITDLYTSPAVLHGPLLFDRLQKAWDSLSVVPCGAFPSLHVGISAVALIYAWKFRGCGAVYRWIWRLYVPLVVSLWVSTVYLRHHWVIDIFAGWFVATLAVVSSDYILEGWRNLRKRYGLST
jgi:membrane-associated phospholipid phosphatase